MSHPIATVTVQAVRLLVIWALLSGLTACGGGQPAGPTLLEQPADQQVTELARATFTATSTSAPAWQWQVSRDDGATWSDIGGATAASYTTVPTRTSDQGKLYRVIASNSLGATSSRGAALSVFSRAIAYEGFDYPLGERLKGQNGGRGWTGAWDVADGNGAPLDISQSGVIASGLRYRDSAGNDLLTSGGAWQTDAGVLRGQALRAGSASFGAAGTERWVSFLVRQAAPSSGSNVATATLGTGYMVGDSALSGGLGGGPSPFVGCFLCTASNTATPGLAAGSVVMVLMRIDFAATGNDNLSLWINPPLNPDTALPPPTLSASAGNLAEVLTGLTLAWGDSRSFTFDELRIAASRENATPFLPVPVRSAGTQVFFTDFEELDAENNSALVRQFTPGTALITPAEGFASTTTFSTFRGSMLRSTTGNTVTLTLADLPEHEWLTLDFLFAAIDSLDGSGAFPAGDFFRITLDGVDIFRESFANASADLIQSYVPPPSALVELARRVDLGFGVGDTNSDSAYWLGRDIIFQRLAHNSSTAVITLRMESVDAPSLADKSWGIDNLRVRVGKP